MKPVCLPYGSDNSKNFILRLAGKTLSTTGNAANLLAQNYDDAVLVSLSLFPIENPEG